MTFAVACTTLGARVPQLFQMIASVPPEVPVAVTWQCATPPPTDLEALSRTRPLVLTTSPRGISAGRNAAADALFRRWSPDAIVFPNDDTLFPPAFFGVLSDIFTGDVLALPVLHRGAGRRWEPRGGLDPLRMNGPATRDVLRGSHEPGLVISAAAFRRAGGFDSRIGVGTDSPWQSGEGPDLVFRIRAQGGSASGSRYPVVLENRTVEPAAQAAAKAAKYAPGVAYVAVRHGGLLSSAVPLAGMTLRLLRSHNTGALRQVFSAVVEGLRSRSGNPDHLRAAQKETTR
jgi:hypothetical protein